MADKRANSRKGNGQYRRSSSSSKKGQNRRGISYNFHIKLKHVLGGVSLLSLLAAFEVFSIPAANGIIDLFGFTEGLAGWTWIFIASASGGSAMILHSLEEKDKYRKRIR